MSCAQKPLERLAAPWGKNGCAFNILDFIEQSCIVNHRSDSNLYPIATTATRHRRDQPTRQVIDGAMSIQRYR